MKWIAHLNQMRIREIKTINLFFCLEQKWKENYYVRDKSRGLDIIAKQKYI